MLRDLVQTFVGLLTVIYSVTSFQKILRSKTPEARADTVASAVLGALTNKLFPIWTISVFELMIIVLLLAGGTLTGVGFVGSSMFAAVALYSESREFMTKLPEQRRPCGCHGTRHMSPLSAADLLRTILVTLTSLTGMLIVFLKPSAAAPSLSAVTGTVGAVIGAVALLVNRTRPLKRSRTRFQIGLHNLTTSCDDIRKSQRQLLKVLKNHDAMFLFTQLGGRAEVSCAQVWQDGCRAFLASDNASVEPSTLLILEISLAIREFFEIREIDATENKLLRYWQSSSPQLSIAGSSDA